MFQPARSGSHLYSAPLHPVRSRTLSSRSYPPLVGLATPLLPCIPHLYLDYITHLVICQALFYDFSYRLATLMLRLPCGIVKGFSVGCPSHSQSVQWLAHRSCSTIVCSKSRLRFYSICSDIQRLGRRFPKREDYRRGSYITLVGYSVWFHAPVGCRSELPSPFVPLLYHNLGDLSRGFSTFFIFYLKNLLVSKKQASAVVPASTPLDTNSIP